MRIIHACPAACKRLPVGVSTLPVALERERKLSQIEQVVKAINRALADHIEDYHRVRPHQALGWLTPAEMENKMASAA